MLRFLASIRAMFEPRIDIDSVGQAPWEWAAGNRLIASDGQYDRDQVQRLAEKDLGPVWCGDCRSLPLYLQAICLATYEASSAGQASSFEASMGRIRDTLNAKGDLATVIARFGGWDKAKETWAQDTASGCGRVSTAALAWLRLGKEVRNRIPAPETIFWIRDFDRPLYYALSSAGHRNCVAEGFIVATHALFEKYMGMPIPDVDPSRYIAKLPDPLSLQP